MPGPGEGTSQNYNKIKDSQERFESEPEKYFLPHFVSNQKTSIRNHFHYFLSS
jgi:hypothetical protein